MATDDGPFAALSSTKDRYVESFHGMTGRVRETFRTNVRDRFRASMRRADPKRASKNAASVATGLVAARVFKGNLVLARLAQSTWVKFSGAGYSAPGRSSEGGRKAGKALAVAIAAAGGSVAVQEPAQAEAMQLDETLAGKLSEVYEAIKAGAQGKGEENGKEEGPQGKGTEGAFEKRQRIEELEGDASITQKALQAVVLPTMATLSKAFMLGFNNTEIYGAEKLAQAICERPPGKALITVCNHVAAMDDPLVLAAVVPQRLILDAHPMRWTLCATDRCFKNPAMSAFFRAVKVLPVERGAGLEQKGMESALAKLDRGEWVHLFPEGSRSRDGGKTIQPIKRGVGRLVAESREAPVVLPFVHLGMAGVIPRGAKMISGGNDIAVLIGDPIPVDDLISAAAAAGASQTQLYDAIAARVGVVLVALKAQLEGTAAQSAAIRAELQAMGPDLVDVIDWDEDVNLGRLRKALLRERREAELQERAASGAETGPPAYCFEDAEAVFGKRERGAKTAPEREAAASPEEPVDAYAGWTALDDESASSRALAATLLGQEQDPLSIVGFAAQALFKARERGREMVPEGWRRERGWRGDESGAKVGRVRSFLRELKNEPRFEELRTQLGGLSSRVNDHFGSSMR